MPEQASIAAGYTPPQRSFPVPPIPLGKDIVVLREKFKISHEDPNSRHTVREIAIRNDSKEERTEFLVLLEDFLVGLWIQDGQGRELTYLPNGVLEQEFGPQDAIIEQLAPGRSMKDTRLLVVLFAEPLKPNSTLVLRLHFWDRESQGRHWWDVVPKHWFEQDKTKKTEYFDTFIEVEGPADSHVVLEPHEGMPEFLGTKETDGVKQNERSNFLQVRAPAGHPRVRFRYRLAPVTAELVLIKIAYHALWAIPLLMLALSTIGLVHLKGDTVVPIHEGQSVFLRIAENRAGELTATLGIAGILSIVAFIRPVWTNRALYLWPLLCNLALLIATLGLP